MTYRYEERDQYEKHCPRCGAKADVDWIHVPTYGNQDQYMPGLATCPTQGCPQNYSSPAWGNGVASGSPLTAEDEGSDAFRWRP